MTTPADPKLWWMPLTIDRHRSVTSTMTHVEHSAFVLLSILLWENKGRVRNDDRWLARNLRLSPREWQAARDAVLQPFTAAGGFIADPEMIAEIDRRTAVIEKRRAAGKASGKARATQQVSNTCSADVEHMGNDARLTSNSPKGSHNSSVAELDDDRPFRVIEGGEK